MDKTRILTREGMKSDYGQFYSMAKRIAFDIEDVPVDLQPLIPYAEFWGISDDIAREELVRAATSKIRENLVSVVRLFDDFLDNWFTGPISALRPPCKEYIAFSAMRMAADFA